MSECRDLNISLHISQKERWSAIDGPDAMRNTVPASRCECLWIGLRVDED